MSRKSMGLALVLAAGLSAWMPSEAYAQCGAELGFGVGVKVINTPNCTDADPNDPPLNVRVCASTGCDVCAWACNGDTGVIQGGPTIAGGYTWWYITWNMLTDCPSNTGWSVQDDHFFCRLQALPPPTGACCFANGTCQSLTYTNCANLGGTRWSENVACASANCPQPQQPVIEVTPASLSFGDVQIGQSATQSFTVRNVGSGTLSGSASGLSAPFSFPSTTSYNLGAAQQTTIQVRFAPTGTGSFTKTVSFSGGGGASRGVSGNGVPVPPSRYTLTLQSSPSSGGTISASPERDPDGKYAAGTQVQLTAYPNTGYTFSSWSGDASGSNNPTTVTMNANRSVTANFPDARDGILEVEPGTDFRTSTYTARGPYDPPSMEYRLTNIGGQPLTWTVSSGFPGGPPPWINVSPTSGSLRAGEQTAVTVAVVPTEVALSLCRYTDRLTFRNMTSGDDTEQRNVVLTVTFICDATPSGQPTSAGIPDAIAKIVIREDRLLAWDDTASTFQRHSGFVPIDPSQPTFILAHGWEGHPWIWVATAQQLRSEYPSANILAWDWEDDANPNHVGDLAKSSLALDLIEWKWRDVYAIKDLPIASDAYEANERAAHQGNLLAQLFDEYPSLGTELHFVGKSLGGGLLAQAAQGLHARGKTVQSLTMIDSPNAYGVNAMKYLNPTSANKTLVFYYDQHLAFLHCGFGAPAPYPSTNLRMNPANYTGDFCMHEHTTDPGQWFPELIHNGLVLDNHVFLYPREIVDLGSSHWWGETDYVHHFDPMGACCYLPTQAVGPGFLGAHACAEATESECVSVPLLGSYADDHTRCESTSCNGNMIAAEANARSVAGSVAADPFPGMVPILTLPLDSAAEWQGDGAVVATGLDPNDPANSVVFLQEDGDATIYRTFQWPANGVLLTFDYMFREPRGDENLTVYIDDRIVFYDHAGTSLATAGLTPGPSVFIADEAGTSGRLAFVLRTDGIPGGGVLLDNVRILAFVPTDVNADRHVDLRDYAVLQRCFGSDPPELECVLVDFDRDQSVALNDHAALQQCLAGPGVLGDPRCNAPPVCGNGILETGEECDPPNGRTCDAACVGSALEADGAIVAWGANEYGQTNVPSPNADFVAIAAGNGHSLALKTDGSIVAWGCNGSDHGECDLPVPNSGFVAVAAGWFHSLGLKADGSIVAWGGDFYGQTNVPAPNADFIGIAAGVEHSLGLKSDGSIVAWGHNNYDQTNVPAPNSGFVAVAAGGFHNLGLNADGSIVAWGYNSEGQANVPAPNTGFVGVAGGDIYSLGLKSDGSIVAWGWNGHGQTNVPAPNADFIAIAAGYSHSLGLKADGSIVAWGYNDDGQTNVPAPNSGFTAISAGAFHSLAIRGNR